MHAPLLKYPDTSFTPLWQRGAGGISEHAGQANPPSLPFTKGGNDQTKFLSRYIDDDTADRRLVALLTHAGHVVVVPASVQLSGAPDTRHFIHAMQRALVLVTRNHDDFLDLHEVVQAAHGTHPGILIIRFDNDPRRDMTPRHIVTAIARLDSAGVPLENQVYILNHWR